MTGSLKRPEVLILGQYRGTELEIIGRTTPVKPDDAELLEKLLKPAGRGHPWPDEPSTHWGRGSKTPIIRVQPTIVVEVSADAALHAGHYRHPLRLVRLRLDVDPAMSPRWAISPTQDSRAG